MAGERKRSPSYPCVNLEKAISLAGLILEQEGKVSATREVIAKALGFSGLNGSSARIIAALSAYGLIERVGKNYKLGGLYFLTTDAVLATKQEALRTAATKPKLFKQLRDHFGEGIPSEANLKSHLEKECGFLPNAATEACAAYRETYNWLNAQHQTSDENNETNEHVNPYGIIDESPSPHQSDACNTKHAVRNDMQCVSSSQEENEILRAPIGRDGYFRLLVKGKAGHAELKKIAEFLENTLRLLE